MTKITDEKLADLRSRIGERIDEPQRYVEMASKDAIRHWMDAIGDDDPLYTDEAYARDGPYGEIVAPGTFLYGTTRVGARGLPGVHAMYAGDEWTWHEPIRRGDVISTESELTDVIELGTKFGGNSVKQVYTVEFYNQVDVHLASRDVWFFRVERESASDRDKYESEGMELAEWTEEDVERFAEHYRNEERRGGTPRYFEDISPGDELDTLLKGPYSVTVAVTFLRGWGSPYTRAHRMLSEMFDDHPALAIPNKYGFPEPPERVHWDEDFAKQAGVPAPYDYGPERVAWLGHTVDHWIGDEGFLKNLYVELRQHNLIGDVTWCSGEVTEKRIVDGEHLVDIDLEACDQRDNVTATGSAVARLPSRE